MSRNPDNQDLPKWHHAPLHLPAGTAYMVTAGTYKRKNLLSGKIRKDHFQTILFQQVEDYEIRLKAWCILDNHYHLVLLKKPETQLSHFIRKLHSLSSRYLNKLDQAPGRKVWYQYWDTGLSFKKSVYARLNYVNQNAVKHGLVEAPENYPWCSAAWLRKNAPKSFVKMIEVYKTDQLRVPDDFSSEP